MMVKLKLKVMTKGVNQPTDQHFHPCCCAASVAKTNSH